MLLTHPAYHLVSDRFVQIDQIFVQATTDLRVIGEAAALHQLGQLAIIRVRPDPQPVQPVHLRMVL